MDVKESGIYASDRAKLGLYNLNLTNSFNFPFGQSLQS
jgi:hypothetical protein